MRPDGEHQDATPRLLSAGEVARILSLSKLHVQTLAVSRELPGIWLENTLLFRLHDVERYQRSHRNPMVAVA